MTRQLISRRRFVGLAVGAAAAGALPFPKLWAADKDDTDKDEKDKYGGFLLGIQSYSLRGYNTDKAIAISKDLGLHSIEFFSAHFSLTSTDAQIEAMKKKVADAGIKIMGHGVNAFSKNHEANKKIFEFAKKAGIKNISADPTEDAFDSLDKLVAEYDIRIAIHNHGPGARYDKVADVLGAVKDRHKNIGACADLGHYIRSAEDPVRVINLLKGRLFGIHLKDFAEQKANAKGVILGKGQLDVAGVFKALRKVEFPADGCLSLEYEEKPRDPIADIKECLAIASEGAKKAAAG